MGLLALYCFWDVTSHLPIAERWGFQNVRHPILLCEGITYTQAPSQALLEVLGPSCGRFVVWGTQPSLCFPVKHGSCVFLTSAKTPLTIYRLLQSSPWMSQPSRCLWAKGCPQKVGVLTAPCFVLFVFLLEKKEAQPWEKEQQNKTNKKQLSIP